MSSKNSVGQLAEKIAKKITRALSWDYEKNREVFQDGRLGFNLIYKDRLVGGLFFGDNVSLYLIVPEMQDFHISWEKEGMVDELINHCKRHQVDVQADC